MRSEVERIDTDGEWQDTRDLLSGDIGVLSLAEGAVRNGSERQLEEGEFYLGPVEELSGNFVAFSPGMAEELNASEYPGEAPIHLGPEDVSSNFYVGHSMGAPWELKVDSDYDLEESEEWHMHDGWELYSAIGGELEIGMAAAPAEGVPHEESVEYRQADDCQLVFVPPYVPHRVTSELGNPTHVVARYSDEKDRISRFDTEGNLDYGWDNSPEFRKENLNSYNQDVVPWFSSARTVSSDD